MSVRTPIEAQTLEQKLAEIKPLTQVFDQLATHTVITDVHGNVLYMNQAAQQMTGYSLEEALGKNPGDLWGGHEDPEYFAEMWKTIKEQKKSFAGRLKNIRKDGTELYQHLNITPILNDQGEINFFVAIETNITNEIKEKNQLHKDVDLLFDSMADRELKMVELKEKLKKLDPSSASN